MYKWYIGHRSGVVLQIFSLLQEVSHFITHKIEKMIIDGV